MNAPLLQYIFINIQDRNFDIISNLHKGPSINDVACLEGGRGVKLTIWGDMRGVGVKENPISSDFMNISRLCFQILLQNEMWFNYENQI